jgi:hypothetical protein
MVDTVARRPKRGDLISAGPFATFPKSPIKVMLPDSLPCQALPPWLVRSGGVLTKRPPARTMRIGARAWVARGLRPQSVRAATLAAGPYT